MLTTRRGSPGWCSMRGRLPVDPRLRFPKFVAASGDGCLEWTGALTWDGYGRISYRGRKASAHRVALELAGRLIPVGYEVDHLCRNRRCVNPDHLDVVTRRTHAKRSIAATSERCHEGHDYSPRNTRIDPRGNRRCRACVAANSRRYQARKRSEVQR